MVDEVSLHRLETEKYAFGLFQSFRIWQIFVEYLMASRNLFEVPGLPNLYIRQNKYSKIVVLVISNVLVDFFVIGPDKNIDDFHAFIASQFQNRIFLIDQSLIFHVVLM